MALQNNVLKSVMNIFQLFPVIANLPKLSCLFPFLSMTEQELNNKIVESNILFQYKYLNKSNVTVLITQCYPMEMSLSGNFT